MTGPNQNPNPKKVQYTNNAGDNAGELRHKHRKQNNYADNLLEL